MQLRVRDVSRGDRIAARAIVMQQKTQRPVQFEILASEFDPSVGDPLAALKEKIDRFSYQQAIVEKTRQRKMNAVVHSIGGGLRFKQNRLRRQDCILMKQGNPRSS